MSILSIDRDARDPAERDTAESDAAAPAASRVSLRDRVMGCWLGKAVGGTLGMPFEGSVAPLDLSFYEPVPTEMLPNDDLDLQVLWAAVIAGQVDAGQAPRVDRRDFGEAFVRCVDFPWDEYGVAIRNLRLGLEPPHTGSFDNWFFNGMGAAIRSEIWACLAPNNPALAAAYAYEDACLDHSGPGIHAEQFFAALQSDAFGHSAADDPRPMIEAACGHIPADSPTCRAVADTVRWWDECRDWPEVRRRVVEAWGNENFTDTTQNVCFTILGWLASEGDFSRAICVAVNCGYDTDCTGATVGALMGILDPGGIGERWLAPIGRQLVVSPPVAPPAGKPFPATLDAFTDEVLRVSDALAGRKPNVGDQPTPDLDELSVTAQLGFADWRTRKGWRDHCGMPPGDVACPELPADARAIRFPGTVGRLAASDFGGPVALLQFAFRVDEDREVLVMFNTPQNVRVWLDGDYAFGRECGRMSPSFHRIPMHQHATRRLSAGEHTLTVALSRPSRGDATWVVGIGDPKSKQWLPHALHGNGPS